MVFITLLTHMLLTMKTRGESINSILVCLAVMDMSSFHVFFRALLTHTDSPLALQAK